LRFAYDITLLPSTIARELGAIDLRFASYHAKACGYTHNYAYQASGARISGRIGKLVVLERAVLFRGDILRAAFGGSAAIANADAKFLAEIRPPVAGISNSWRFVRGALIWGNAPFGACYCDFLLLAPNSPLRLRQNNETRL
jgi:hypothetical protein